MLWDILEQFNVAWWRCLILSVAAFVLAILIIDRREKLAEIAREPSEGDNENLFDLDQREAREMERREEEVAAEFRLFARLRIEPTEEWRLRAAKVWKIPTPEELDKQLESHLAAEQDVLPNKSS